VIKVDKVRKKVAAAAKRARKMSALIVEGSAIMRCPVDTGNLRGSLTYKVNEDGAEVGTNVDYAAHVEFGTVRQKAQPYLRPALDENETAIKRVYAKEIGNALK
jgi:HK97 gp10 family phage protein